MALISDLFTAENLQQNDNYGLDKTLNHKGLSDLFLSYAKNYCTKIWGMSEEKCTKPIKGCGLNSGCPIGKICINDPSSKAGYVCKPSKD